VEAIITTMDAQGTVHVAPLGVYWGTTTMLLKPYRDTTLYHDLLQHPAAVVNLTDDAPLIAYTSVAAVDLPLVPLASGRGYRLAGCCSYYEVEVQECDDSAEYAEVRCRVVERGHVRDFIGFNRASAVLVEAAILATRVPALGAPHVLAEFDRFTAVVDETGLAAEREALRFLRAYVEDEVAGGPP
jgi:hypothetical protein